MDRDQPEIIREPGSTRILLPLRRLPRVLGFSMLGAGVMVSAFMVFWMGGPITGGLNGASGINWFAIGFGLLGSPMLLLGLGCMAIGVGLLVSGSRCDVTIADDGLHIREHLGVLYWTWQVPVAAVTALIAPSGADRGETVLLGQPMTGALRLRRRGRRDLLLIPGYDGHCRRVVAEALIAQLPGVPVMDDPTTGPPPGVLSESVSDHGVTINLPVRRVGIPVLFFAMICLGAVGTVTVLALRAQSTGAEETPGRLPLLVLLPFWALGLALLACGLHGISERGNVRWDVDGLTWERRSWLRRRVRRWSADELAAVRSEEHGTGSGKFRALTVTATGTTKPVRIDGLDRTCQEWIAARIERLRRGEVEAPAPTAGRVLEALTSPPAPAALPADAAAALPDDSPITVTTVDARLVIDLPVRGLRRGSPGFTLGLIFTVFGAGAAVATAVFITETGTRIGVPLFLSLFAVVGLAITFAGLRQGTRRTRLELDRERLTIDQHDCFGVSHHELPRRSITAIRVEPTGTTVNDRVFYHLVIASDQREDLHCGSECSQAELAAVASRLRAGLSSDH